MEQSNKKQLSIDLRKKILQFAAKTNSAYPHIGSCFSSVDLMIETLLYQMKSNDKFILSKGHAALALYVVMNKKGIISDNQLDTYFKEGGLFGIHPPSTFPKDIPLPTGSLGHGLSFASGIAKGYLLQKKSNNKVYCLMSDGECDEGAVWEAALFAAQHKLKNLFVVIDKNGFQGIDATDNVLGEAAAVNKWRAFGFNVVACDGHDFNKLEKAFETLRKSENNKPNIIIATTKRGHGIKSIEGKMISNYYVLTEDKLEGVLKELK